MARKKMSTTDLVRAVEYLEPYPAVLLPVIDGGFEVIFPNFPRVRSYGPTAAMAQTTAQDMLTSEISLMIAQGEAAPTPSDPDRLIPDEDEPPGTRMVMITPDLKRLRKRFNLEKRERGMALGLGRLGR